MRTPGIDPQLRICVGQLPRGKQPLHLRSVGGKRTTAVGRQSGDKFLERNVEPHGHAVHVDGDTVIRVIERSTPRGDDAVTKGKKQAQNVPLDRAKVRLAAFGEDLGNGSPLAGFDQLVNVLRAPPESLGEKPRHSGLARGHEPDQINFVRPHRVSRASSSKNPGYETSTEVAPVIVVAAEARVAAIANAMASR